MSLEKQTQRLTNRIAFLRWGNAHSARFRGFLRPSPLSAGISSAVSHFTGVNNPALGSAQGRAPSLCSLSHFWMLSSSFSSTWAVFPYSPLCLVLTCGTEGFGSAWPCSGAAALPSSPIPTFASLGQHQLRATLCSTTNPPSNRRRKNI